MRRSRTKNRTGVGVISFIVLMLFVIISYNRIGLADEIDKKHTQATRLDEQIQEQVARSHEISDRIKYVQSDEYIEDIARNELGLVYKDDVIFEKENKN